MRSFVTAFPLDTTLCPLHFQDADITGSFEWTRSNLHKEEKIKFFIKMLKINVINLSVTEAGRNTAGIGCMPFELPHASVSRDLVGSEFPLCTAYCNTRGLKTPSYHQEAFQFSSSFEHLSTCLTSMVCHEELDIQSSAHTKPLLLNQEPLSVLTDVGGEHLTSYFFRLKSKEYNKACYHINRRC